MFNDIDATRISNIQTAESLLAEMSREADKYKKLSEMALRNLVTVIKENVSYAKYEFTIEKAHKVIASGEEGDAYRNVLAEYIEHDITGKPVTVDSILTNGYDTYGWSIKFTCDSHRFELTVPNTQRMSVSNISYISMGKLYLGMYTSDSCISYICMSYDICDLKEKFERLAKVEYDLDSMPSSGACA